MADYPRDLVGYGATPPHAQWPGGAQIAVQFVINYEEGGENAIFHGDVAAEAFLNELVGAQPVPGLRNPVIESLFEYGSRAGFWRLHRTFTSRNVPITVYAVAMAIERNPAAVDAMMNAGWEIATHGYRWIDYQYVPESVEREHIQKAIEIQTRMTGSRPLGWYQGRCSPNTPRLVAEEGGFLYNADYYGDDLPFWDTRYANRAQLIVPYAFDSNDMRFGSPQGFNSGDQFFTYLKDSFDVLYREGAERPRMMSIGMHCRLLGRPGRTAALERFIDYVAGHDKVWFATRLDIARHWIATHPFAG
jgi:putative urate catabolism protein